MAGAAEQARRPRDGAVPGEPRLDSAYRWAVIRQLNDRVALAKLTQALFPLFSVPLEHFLCRTCPVACAALPDVHLSSAPVIDIPVRSDVGADLPQLALQASQPIRSVVGVTHHARSLVLVSDLPQKVRGLGRRDQFPGRR